MYILGISAFYHDAAAALIKDGEIISAAQEERFTRIKHDESFPHHAISYCLEHEKITVNDLDAVVFYEKPFLKFERLLETYLAFAPVGVRSFIKAMNVWANKKLFIKKIIRDGLKKINENKHVSINVLFSEHHLSHAASAYYTSPYNEAAILNVDAVGEWATTSIYHAKGNQITCLREMHFPHSLGLLYSAFTYYLGFKVNSGEYKLMGMAPYGNSNAEETQQFKKLIEEKMCHVYDDGSIFMKQDYFNYAAGLTMANDKKWEQLFGFKKRAESEQIGRQHCNLALAIQQVTEGIILKLAQEAKRLTGSDRLCMAGGVALNCVANGRLLDAEVFQEIYIQPAAGDAGGALGAALAAYHIYYGHPIKTRNGNDGMQAAFLGPSFSDVEIEQALISCRAVYSKPEEDALYDKVAGLLEEGSVAGWFRGRMEFGPRALGNRSIIADPRNRNMQQQLNLKIKFRESFRPFAPAVKLEKCKEYFSNCGTSPYMLFTRQVQDNLKYSLPANYQEMEPDEKRDFLKSSLPAITHADGSARVQTVDKKDNPAFWNLLDAFEKRTGCAVLVNTSFNVRGEPIVCTALDAIRCFMRTGMDVLVMNGYLLIKNQQTEIKDFSGLSELHFND